MRNSLVSEASSTQGQQKRANRRQAGSRKRLCAVTLAAAAVPIATQFEARADISGFGDGSNWTINSSGIFTPTFNSPSDLTITDAQNSEANSVFFNDTQRDNNFTAKFHYNFLNGSANPADGVAFVIQNSPAGANALGGGGGNLGYGGIANSAAFEINIYAPNTRGTAYHEQGATGGYQAAGAVDWSDPNGVDITLQYNGTFLTETITQGANTFTNRIAADIATAV